MTLNGHRISLMAKSLRGQFLIAAKHLRDSNFYKSIVLMLEHNDEGAMGLIVNRPTHVSVSQALSQHFDLPSTEHFLFNGGPVEENALLILHNSTDFDQEHEPIVPGVFVGTSPDIFDRVTESMNEPDSEFRFRIYSGYSGWGAGQLEFEMSRGDWFTLPATAEFIFRSDPYEVWEDVLAALQRRHRIVPESEEPASPEWN